MATTQPSGFANLLALINANTDGITFTANDFTLGSPTAVASPASDDVNTTIVATAASGSHYKDSVTLTYGRPTIGGAIPSADGNVFVWRAIGNQGFVDQYNTLTGASLDISDIGATIDLTSAAISDTSTNVTAAATSLIVQGTSAVPVEIFPLEETQDAASRLVTYLNTTLPGYDL